MSEKTENTFEVVSWYHEKGLSKAPYTKREVANIYLDKNVETLHKLEKVFWYVLFSNTRE